MAMKSCLSGYHHPVCEGVLIIFYLDTKYGSRQIWFPPNMVPAKAALNVELHIVPRGTIQTKHGTQEPHGPSVISMESFTMDMRFHWLKCRLAQHLFDVMWRRC